MPKYNQKGIIPILIPLVIGIIVITGIYLISKKPSNPPTTGTIPQNSPTATTTPTSTTQWKTYKAEKYGYSIKHPQNWVVEDLSSEGDQLIRIKDDQKSAFVLIETIIGPSLEKEGELEKVFIFLEDKLKKNTHLKINEFTKSTNTIDKDIMGYIARGEETYSDKTVLFEERFQVGKNGRGIRFHSAYTPDSKEINQPITSAIINSFKAIK